MARADLLLNLVRAGAKGDQASFRKAIEALIAEERTNQHHILADRLAAHLAQNSSGAPTVQCLGARETASPRTCSMK